MLLTVTPNPAIDRVLIVPGFRHADVCRVVAQNDAAGGKGFNVTRVARTLNLPVRACALLGGENGRRIARLAEDEGIDGAWRWIAQGESRICLLITDPEARDHLSTKPVRRSMPATGTDSWNWSGSRRALQRSSLFLAAFRPASRRSTMWN